MFRNSIRYLDGVETRFCSGPFKSIFSLFKKRDAIAVFEPGQRFHSLGSKELDVENAKSAGGVA